MKNILVALIAACFVFGIAGSALAGTVQLNNTYSKSQIGSDCKSAGGKSFTLSDGTYGCAANGNSVACNKDGTCIGTCPACGSRLLPTQNLIGVLGVQSPAATGN